MTAARQDTTFKGVTRAHPCALCDGTDGCSVGADGLLLCRRKEGQQSGFVHLGRAKADSAWTQYRREGDPMLTDAALRAKQSSPFASRIPGSNGQHKSAIDWQAKADGFRHQLSPVLAGHLADALGLPVGVMAELHVGYTAEGPHPEPGGPCWTFPELNAAGQAVGITCRYLGGEKKAFPGGSRGLSIPDRWQERDGPILLPEGQSDTLALTAAGLAAIGRPSNMGGVDHLAALLASVPADREIIVLGELDPNDKGQWPGREGAIKTASELMGKLGRPVHYAFPPDGAKDVRAWVRSKSPDLTCLDEWNDLGETLLRSLRTMTVKPTEVKLGYAFEWKPTDSTVFAEADYRPRWQSSPVLVEKMPCILGGAQKVLKTTLALDLAISLASGTPWLGKFNCPVRKRVAVLSGESGPFTLQETARRICVAKGICFADLADSLLWQFTLPQLANINQLEALRAGLVRDCVEVVLNDPLYLSLLAGGDGSIRAENMYETGPLLLRVATACLEAGTTPILLHHTKKGSGREGEPLELTDLAFSGIAEFARQWLLLSRREAYEAGTGLHKLWLSVGGSIGHGGLFAIDVNEGVIGEDFTGRTWDLTVQTAAEAKATTKGSEADRKAESLRERNQTDDTAFLASLSKIAPEGEAVPYGRVRDLSGLSRDRASGAFERFIAQGIVLRIPDVEITVGNGAKRTVVGIQRKPDPDAQAEFT